MPLLEVIHVMYWGAGEWQQKQRNGQSNSSEKYLKLWKSIRRSKSEKQRNRSEKQKNVQRNKSGKQRNRQSNNSERCFEAVGKRQKEQKPEIRTMFKATEK